MTMTSAELFNHAYDARRLLEKAWSPETAFQGITIGEGEPLSRGQCGVSSLYLARRLVDLDHEAYFTEGKLILGRGEARDHVWVETPIETDELYVADLTSDQHRTLFGSTVHIGSYDTETPVKYVPSERWNPYEIPHRKLKARYEILETRIDVIQAGFLRRLAAKLIAT